MADAAFGHMARDAFAHAVKAFLLFGFVKSARGLDFQGISKKEREGAAKHAEFGFQDVEDVFQQLFHVAFVDNRDANLLDD